VTPEEAKHRSRLAAGHSSFEATTAAGGVKLTSARFLWHMRPYFRQVAGELVLGSLCGILMNTAVVLPALLLGRAVDEVLRLSRGQSTPSAVTLAAALVVAGTLATEVPRIGKRWWLITANARIRGSMRADAFRGVAAWPMARLHRTPIGDLMARTVGDVEVLGVGVREFTIEMWDTVLFSISLVVTMLVLDPGLTVVALLPVPLAMLLARASGRWIAERTTAARQVNAQLTAAIQEQLAGVRVLRLFGRRAAAVAQVGHLSQRQAEANLGLIRLRAGLSPVYSTLMTAGIVAVVWLGGERVLTGALSVGSFVAYLELFGRFVGRSYRIPQLVNSVQSGAAAYARLEPLLAPPLSVDGEPPCASFRPGRLPRLDAEPELATPAHPGPVAVAIRGASFQYPGASQPAFKELCLDIPAGAFVAITGPVGSGKSALARCLAGLYPLADGAILLDGTAATEAIPGVVGYAPQEGYLFSGPVWDNVALGGAYRSDELERVLRLAGMEAEIKALPQGIDTPIGERGVRISGGQRQRLGLARAAGVAAPTTPGLLVLDDPFSAVDIDTEARIVANLRCAFGPGAPPAQRSTVVLLSHRLGAFPHADLVVVLEGGRFVERGTHAALVQAGGLYARIYRAQQRVEGAAVLAGSPQ
jgi:ABC-type multidrug transport system fused ATPase/permease subunit